MCKLLITICYLKSLSPQQEKMLIVLILYFVNSAQISENIAFMPRLGIYSVK